MGTRVKLLESRQLVIIVVLSLNKWLINVFSSPADQSLNGQNGPVRCAFLMNKDCVCCLEVIQTS